MSDEQDFNELEDPDVELDNVPKGDDDEGDGEEEKAPAASADSSEEEDDDAENEYEADGFVVDEEEEGEGEEGDSDKEEKKKKKKKKRRRDYQLDEEDYALLEDNQVVVSSRDGKPNDLLPSVVSQSRFPVHASCDNPCMTHWSFATLLRQRLHPACKQPTHTSTYGDAEEAACCSVLPAGSNSDVPKKESMSTSGV